MDTNKTPKRPWWRKKRWLAAGLLWPVLGYLLSEGPAVYAASRDWVSWPHVYAAFRPAETTLGDVPLLSHARQAYRRWWIDLGLRRRTRVSGRRAPDWEVIVSSDVDHTGIEFKPRGDGVTLATWFGGHEVTVANGRRTPGEGFRWDGPVRLDGRPVAALPRGTARLSIGYFDGELSVEADRTPVEVED